MVKFALPLAHTNSHDPNWGSDPINSAAGHNLANIYETVHFLACEATGLSLTSGIPFYAGFGDIKIAKPITSFLIHGVAAAGSLTLARMALYSLSGSTWTMVAQSNEVHASGCTELGNQTGVNQGLWAHANTIYQVPVTMDGTGGSAGNGAALSSYTPQVGTRYLASVIGVESGAAPTVAFKNALPAFTNNTTFGRAFAGKGTSLADLPMTIANANLNNTTGAVIWIGLK